jgi:regulator of replication initiation timing
MPSFSMRITVGLVAFFLAAAGCDQVRDRLGDQAKEAADAAAKAGKHRSARDLYESALDGTEKTADIHFRLGLLCDENLEDPAGADCHYGRYLDFVSKGGKADEAKRLRTEVRRKLSRNLNDSSLLAKEVARLKNENQELRNETVRLRGRLDAKRGQPEARSAEAAKQISGRTYTVQPGDTLAGISRKFFKSPNRWKDIQDANFQQLGDNTSLKPGQTLIIPAR